MPATIGNRRLKNTRLRPSDPYYREIVLAEARALLQGLFTHRSAEEMHWWKRRRAAKQRIDKRNWLSRDDNRAKETRRSKEWQRKHPEKVRESNRQNWEQLGDNQVLRSMLQNDKTLDPKDIPDSLIKAWRARILLKRELKKERKKHESNDQTTDQGP